MSSPFPVIDLVLTGAGRVPWTLGAVQFAATTLPEFIATETRHLQEAAAGWVLYWDPALGTPNETVVRELIAGPWDVCHAGLRLGLLGQPEALDCVQPVWAFTRDPDPQREAASWRLSFRACLVKVDVVRRQGFVSVGFRTLDVAGLEWGHRLLWAGVLLGHCPQLVANAPGVEGAGLFQAAAPSTVWDDGLQWVARRYGRRWERWAAFRAWCRGRISLGAWWRVVRGSTGSAAVASPPAKYRRAGDVPGIDAARLPRARGWSVSVLIPTVDRYPYLRTLLGQLRNQTFPAKEIIIVDQSPLERRAEAPWAEFRDLPLVILDRSEPGQCTSRNAGLRAATGTHVLLLDDDIEAEPNLIEAHLATLAGFRATVSSGVAQEVGADPLGDDVRVIRASDVFPAGNSMVAVEALSRSGLFDLAYDKGSRADADLGMRLYLAGERMILNGGIEVLHHHAPMGGLRRHGARRVTRNSSRAHLWHRHLPSRTEVYLARRYYTAAQVREMFWLRVLGTFSGRGARWRRLAKVVASAVALPHTWWKLRQSQAEATAMLARFPEIPTADGDRMTVPK